MLFTISIVIDHGAQPFNVENLNVFALDFQDLFVLEAGEQAADCLEGQPEITADLLA